MADDPRSHHPPGAMEPTGPSGSTVIRVGVLTDLHLAPLPQPQRGWHNPYDYGGARPRLRRALAAFAEADVDAVAVLGDRDSLDEVVRGLAEGSDAPVLVVPGNHDRHRGGHDLEDALQRTAGRVAMAGRDPIEIAGLAFLGVVADRAPGGRGYVGRP